MNRFYLLFSLLILSALPEKVLAHGANIEYRQSSAITIQATYDDGTPMTEAQVVVYAPSDPTKPWLTGTTDKQGNFTFVPDTDAANAGNWDVKVRQAGHGRIVSIPVTDGQLSAIETSSPMAAETDGYSPMQKLVMAATGIWGFVGTALFFSRHKSSGSSN